MKRTFFISFFLCISLICLSHNNNQALNRFIYKVSKQNRDLIKKFILSEGEFKYYNEFYGNCPFYQFNNVDVYLLPIDSLINKADEYNEYRNPTYDKYALSLKYNDKNTIEQTNNKSVISNIRLDINYILEVVKDN